jgi:putative endonuclease
MKYGGSVYIMANATHTVLYIGATADLYVHVQQHKDGYNENAFTAKNNCKELVYYEGLAD